jgi:hypothetical protein
MFGIERGKNLFEQVGCQQCNICVIIKSLRCSKISNALMCKFC